MCKNDDDEEEESRSLVQNHANKSFERKLKMCECVFGSFKEGSSFFSKFGNRKVTRENREGRERGRKTIGWDRKFDRQKIEMEKLGERREEKLKWEGRERVSFT